MSKKKGILYERELFHMLWDSKKWGVVRSAGSGSTPLPSPDLIAGNGSNLLAIECKFLKKKSKHFNKEEILQLRRFSKLINAIPVMAMRFNKEGWYFLDANKIKKTKGGNYTITLDLCKKRGVKFEELMKNETPFDNNNVSTNNS